MLTLLNLPEFTYWFQDGKNKSVIFNHLCWYGMYGNIKREKVEIINFWEIKVLGNIPNVQNENENAQLDNI